MSQKVMKIAGWVFTALLSFLFAMSAFLKLSADESAIQAAASIGLNQPTYLFIGIIELFALVLFIIPRTGVLGGLLLIAYMGGAIATHLEHQQSVAMAIAVQILVWITLIIRFPEIRQRLIPLTQKVK